MFDDAEEENGHHPNGRGDDQEKIKKPLSIKLINLFSNFD